ncbi:MAG: hypothetical protein E7638_06245 [Ruminococcaceae bacterium]|nr:hypothetical protein [Oscillospiraceae bacterium]
MPRHYQNFMRILTSDTPGEPTLFEPFINRKIAEQLIWRRGEHLWSTPESYIETLVSLGECTGSDVITADTRLFEDQLTALYRAIYKTADDTLRFVTLCRTAEAARLADKCGGVCAVGVFGEARSKKPMIRMDGRLTDAVKSGCAGWFAPRDAERYWNEASDYIAVLGGLGADYISSTGPASIHKRCECIYRVTDNRRYALGSGGCLTEEHYLELISLLGVYKKYKY